MLGDVQIAILNNVTVTDRILSFTFAAAGDAGFGTGFTTALDKLQSVGANFFLMLGDFSYVAKEQSWCNTFKSKFSNVELIVGNHDSGETSAGNINLYTIYCPFTLNIPINNGSGINNSTGYGKEYYFDYPQSNPIMRFILVCSGTIMVVDGTGTCSYTVGNLRYNWVSNAIDDARAKHIKWIIVADHKPRIEAGGSDGMDSDLFQLLISKKVDLVLSGHAHNYERSKQVAFGPNCTSVTSSYNANCVVNDGSSGNYTAGAGMVWSIIGTFGEFLQSVSANNWFAITNGITHGFSKFTVTSTTIAVQFYNSDGNFTDAYAITGP